MKGLNLSTFKKIKEDKHSATMMHKNGHSLIISKSGLPIMQRKQLEALQFHKSKEKEPNNYDEGGEVAASYNSNPSTLSDQSPLEIEPASQDQNSGTQQQENRAPSSQSEQPQTPMQAKGASFAAEKSANLAGAQAIQQQGNSEQQALQQAQDQVAALPTQNDIIQAHQSQNNALFKAYQDKQLDPDHYWENHSKVAAGIGMVLSGLGSSFSGHNVALETINNGINRDIEAQKNSQDQKMNLWKMNREALGSDLAANLATQNQLYTGLKYKLEQAASTAKGPIALANAQAANARIDQQLAMNNFKLSLMNPTSDNPDPASRVQFLVPSERQQKVFDEIGAAQETKHNAPGILQSFDKAASNIHATDFVPGMQNVDQKALHTLLGPTFKDVEGTVRQAAMDNLFGNITPQFGDDTNTIQTKRAALQGYLRSKSAAPTAKGFGIDLNKYPSTNLSFSGMGINPLEGKTIVNSKTGQRAIMQSGQWKPIGK